jgi:sugar transferase (PEP-CTERM/EpsH1 system associated)
MSNRQLTVTHVTYSLELGGLEVMIVEFLRRIDRSRFAPRVCTIRPASGLAQELSYIGVPVDSINAPEGLSPLLPLRLRKLFAARGVDLVHTHNVNPWLYAGSAARCLRGVGLVHTEHSYKEFYGKRRMRVAGQWLGRLSDRVVADSADVAAFLAQRLHVDPNRLLVIYNGVDVDRYRATDPADSRPPVDGLPPQGPRIGIVARLAPIKNHALLLRAFPRVLARVPTACLLIVGDGPLRSELEALSSALRISDRVRFLGARRDIPELMRRLDLFVLPSVSEGCSLTVLEAMASGVPVVATEVGGTSELVENGHTGLLVASMDVRSLADAITRLLLDEGLRRTFGAAGRQRVCEFFSLNQMVRTYEQMYDEVWAARQERWRV